MRAELLRLDKRAARQRLPGVLASPDIVTVPDSIT